MFHSRGVICNIHGTFHQSHVCCVILQLYSIPVQHLCRTPHANYKATQHQSVWPRFPRKILINVCKTAFLHGTWG